MRGITPTDFQTYIATVVLAVWYWWRDRYADQQNKKENPRIVFSTDCSEVSVYPQAKKQTKRTSI